MLSMFSMRCDHVYSAMVITMWLTMWAHHVRILRMHHRLVHYNCRLHNWLHWHHPMLYRHHMRLCGHHVRLGRHHLGLYRHHMWLGGHHWLLHMHSLRWHTWLLHHDMTLRWVASLRRIALRMITWLRLTLHRVALGLHTILGLWVPRIPRRRLTLH